jgi:hypothetical protein
MRITAAVLVGSSVDGAIREAIAVCSKMRSATPISLDRQGGLYDFVFEGDDSDQVTMSVVFNDINITVTADSDPELIYRDWSRAMSGYIEKTVGPNPSPVLTDEEKANDARIGAENKREYDERRAEYVAEVTAKQNATEAKLAGAPAMEFADERAWLRGVKLNTDPYGRGIITFAERWARLMQLEMANGRRLENIASATSDEADTEGITGFMYGVAVSTLASCWKHGDQLRRWHNLDTQLGDEGERANKSGGTLNPAIINLGK